MSIIEADLIDLDNSLPTLPQSLPNAPFEGDVSDSLLDSELPILERKLQNAHGPRGGHCSSRRSSSVDVEDILISIDDDEVECGGSSSRASLGALHEDRLDKATACADLGVLAAAALDGNVLSASLATSSDDEDEVAVQQCVEECLLDLDNYLRGLDSGEEGAPMSGGSSSADEWRSGSGSSLSGAGDAPEDEAALRCRLRQVEENYARFVAAGRVNRAFEPDGGGALRRTGSEASLRPPPLARGRPCRATVAAPAGRAWRANGRTSGTAAGDSDEDVDWSWVQDVARDVTLERRAHAARDCCTGTVVVEPLRAEPGTSASGQEADGAVVGAPTASWLRSSMRRLRHFRLPSDDVPRPVEGRPLSAPSRLAGPPSRARPQMRQTPPTNRGRSSSASSRSRRPRSPDSSASISVASTEDSSPSCTPAPTPMQHASEPCSANSDRRRPCERPSIGRHSDMPEVESPLGHWPHSLSSMMACLSCTLGLFNISRFAILSIHFGANFIFQFFLLSMVFGLPLLTLQMCLGQQLGAGVIDMWRISPLFQGVGMSLLIAQGLLGMYSIIGVSWMFVFFRDSFITKFDKYRWAEPFLYYREDMQVPINGTYKLSETVPDYFSGIVLQRHHLASGSAYGTIKFQLAFNLAVVWMIVFVSLSKGLRSYGKVIYVFILLPVFGTFVLCAKLLGIMPPEYMNVMFPETSWQEFFFNSKSWLAAAQEVFLTWGLLGTAVMQIASHNKHKHLLQRDSSLVAIITFTVLLLVAFLANICVQILRSNGYAYLPDSFERMPSYVFLRSIKDPLPPTLAGIPVRYMYHNSYVMGEAVLRPGIDYVKESGYQALRFATELIPTTFAVLGAERLSPFWAVLFYFVIILFGIAQQLAIWHCVITGIMAIRAKVLKSWETTITLFSCACGFVLGLPMATELGIYVVYFMDYTVGGFWWLIIVVLLQIMAVFVVRGRPYSGDAIVTALFTPNNHPCLLSWAPVLLSFIWNVILPVILAVVCIATFKNGNFKELFIWHQSHAQKYWPVWIRQIGSMIQLLPILFVPIVAVIQSYRYLNNGPPDILDRIQLLYRPPLGDHMADLSIHESTRTSLGTSSQSPPHMEDPPPKYTPPPSYSTATGARIAKFLRQSIRRSVRRLATVLGETSNHRQRPVVQQQPPPPDYNAVLVEMNQTISTIDGNIRVSTLERLRNVQQTPGSPTLTAAEVASILRSSFRRSTVRRGTSFSANEIGIASLSAENLVDSAAPIGETSLVLSQLPSVEIKCETDNLSSVI